MGWRRSRARLTPRDETSGRRRAPGPADGSSLSDYDYELPPELIARYPAKRRDRSRLLVLRGEHEPPRHLRFTEITGLVEAGDVVVVNESKVIRARLLGKRSTGGAAEVLLLSPVGGWDPAREPGRGTPRHWEALVRPGRKLAPGSEVLVGRGDADAELRIAVGSPLPGGARVVELHSDLPVWDVVEHLGEVPLPPYMGRAAEPIDRDRYQTVYARTPGSVAAPTAGLHFTSRLLSSLEKVGACVATVTLHVGAGTFKRVDRDQFDRRKLHSESFSIPQSTAEAINRARDLGGRVWAVGTTTVRALESAKGGDGRMRTFSGSTGLFIRPPFAFRVVDALITNFHLPRSSLLMLVAALGGYERVMKAYSEAVERRYRFYSYGDAMAIIS